METLKPLKVDQIKTPKEEENKPKIDFEALQEDVNRMELHDDFDELNYRDVFYYILYVDDDAFEGPAMWGVSQTGHYDVDIEVKLGISDSEKRIAILHEVIEAELTQSQGMSMEEAHEEASKCDKQYKDSFFSTQ